MDRSWTGLGKAVIVFAGSLFANWTIAVDWNRVLLPPRAHTIMRGARRT